MTTWTIELSADRKVWTIHASGLTSQQLSDAIHSLGTRHSGYWRALNEATGEYPL